MSERFIDPALERQQMEADMAANQHIIADSMAAANARLDVNEAHMRANDPTGAGELPPDYVRGSYQSLAASNAVRTVPEDFDRNHIVVGRGIKRTYDGPFAVGWRNATRQYDTVKDRNGMKQKVIVGGEIPVLADQSGWRLHEEPLPKYRWNRLGPIPLGFIGDLGYTAMHWMQPAPQTQPKPEKTKK
ncbi:MAG TPA: hypothetical protein VLH86_03640 [Patescibacteria group bacterium]|nr:hypothetical protein [Patescibacteria group bacterium]